MTRAANANFSQLRLANLRLVKPPLVWARPSVPTFTKQRGSNALARVGLTFERRVEKELTSHVATGHITRVVHNPWFAFEDASGSATCSPDFILWKGAKLYVVEVKLTWVPEALPKLRGLYVPVLHKVFNVPIVPFVIVRHSAPGAPPPVFTLSEAMNEFGSVLLWPQNRGIMW